MTDEARPQDKVRDAFHLIEESLARQSSHRAKNATYLQAYGGETAPPVPPTRIDARCMAEGKHVGCNCAASPVQPADYVILRHRARTLAMQGLQSDRFLTDRDFRDAVRAVLEVTHVYD